MFALPSFSSSLTWMPSVVDNSVFVLCVCVCVVYVCVCVVVA